MLMMRGGWLDRRGGVWAHQGVTGPAGGTWKWRIPGITVPTRIFTVPARIFTVPARIFTVPGRVFTVPGGLFFGACTDHPAKHVTPDKDGLNRTPHVKLSQTQPRTTFAIPASLILNSNFILTKSLSTCQQPAHRRQPPVSSQADEGRNASGRRVSDSVDGFVV